MSHTQSTLPAGRRAAVSGSDRPKLHGGDGHLVSNLVTFGILTVILLAGFYVLNFVEKNVVWPYAASIGLITVAYFVAIQILGRADSLDKK